MDRVDRATRSRIMASIGSKDTKPEMALRKAAHAAGLRYLLHDKRLPGKPDIVFPSARVAVYVNGCFWHRHDTCFRAPKTNTQFWESKLEANVARDIRVKREVEAMGWRHIIVWECEIKKDVASVVDSLHETVKGKR